MILNDMSHSQQSENDCQSVSRNMDLRDASASINCSPSLNKFFKKGNSNNVNGCFGNDYGQKPYLDGIWMAGDDDE